MKKCERNNPEDTKHSKEGRERVAQSTRTDFTAGCGEDQGEQIASLQPMEDHSGVDTNSEACGGPCAGESLYALKEAAACGDERTQEQVCW